jgi:hypothetical protein
MILTQDELVEFLKDATLPSFSFDETADATAERIIKLANGGKISDITDIDSCISDLSPYQFSVIKAVETALSTPLPKNHLKDYISNKNFHHLTAEIRVKAILATGPNELHLFATDKQSDVIKFKESNDSKKADEGLLTKILNATDNELDEMMANTPVASNGSANKNKAEPGQSSAPSSTTPPASNSKSAIDLNSSSSVSNKGDKSEVPFYKTTWFMVLSGVIFLSAIGGGAYMISRKIDNTDL